jgi:hypothetical protein
MSQIEKQVEIPTLTLCIDRFRFCASAKPCGLGEKTRHITLAFAVQDAFNSDKTVSISADNYQNRKLLLLLAQVIMLKCGVSIFCISRETCNVVTLLLPV